MCGSFILAIPAFTGTRGVFVPDSFRGSELFWIPAFAGMTGEIDDTPYYSSTSPLVIRPAEDAGGISGNHHAGAI